MKFYLVVSKFKILVSSRPTAIVEPNFLKLNLKECSENNFDKKESLIHIIPSLNFIFITNHKHKFEFHTKS